MVGINVINFLRIGYHIVSNELSQSDIVTYQNQYYETFELIKKLPMNYLQLENPSKYFLIMSNSFPKIGYFLHRCSLNKIQLELVNDTSNQCLINFFFIDENVDYDLLKGYFSPYSLRYILIQNDFESANELLKLINNDDTFIRKKVNGRFPDFKLDEWQNGVENNKTYFIHNSFESNNVGENNYYVLNHMIGDFWTKNISELQTEEHLAHEPDLSKLILQAKKIDTVEAKIYSDANKKLPSLTSVILVVPHQKDDIYEQDFYYNFKPKTIEDDAAKIKRYFRGLDDIVFHQAIPTFSPVIRTPLVRFKNFSQVKLFYTLQNIEKKYKEKRKNQIKKLKEKRNREVKLNFNNQNKLDNLIRKYLVEKKYYKK